MRKFFILTLSLVVSWIMTMALPANPGVFNITLLNGSA